MVKKLWSREEDGQLPNWLNEEQKSRCYCDDRGWVLVHKDGNEEVIVAANTLNDPAEKGHGFDPVTGESLDPDRASAHNEISYSLSKSTEMVNEGDFVKITLETTGVADNTLVPYTIEGVESEDLTAGQISGSFSITGGKGTVDLTAVRDSLTEGTQTLVLKLPTGESISVDVGDTSKTPSYNLSAPQSSNENSSFDITLNASHAPANTQIGYTLSGSVDLANDFNEVMSQTGFFTVGSDTQENSSDSLTFNVKDDKTWAEGDETLILTLDGGLGTITVNIVDSSIADPVYELVAPQSSNENSSFDITLNATNVPTNTQIGYTLSGSVDLANDFNEVMSQTGFFTVGSDTLANSSDSLTFNVKDDKTWSEGDETLILTLDGGLGTVQVNITDSSIAGSVYELQALPSVNEGEALTITLNANNVPANTQIGYTLSGSVNLNTDFDEVVPSSGSFTVGSDTLANSSDSLTLNVKDDKTWAEGDETLTLTLDGGLGTITVNIVDSSIADPVYELVAPTSSNEGESFDITLNATNVPANTQIGYTLSGSANLNTDFNEVMSQTGFFTVGSDTLANSSDSLTFNVRNDSSFEEGDKELTLTLDGGLGTVTIPIIDSSRAIATFGLSSNPLNQASEGGPLTISLTYQNVSVGTEIGYNLTGSTVNLNTDFDPPVSNTGKFIIGQQEDVTFNIVADESFEEGNEVLKLTLDNGKASIQVPIIDTSTATPSYNLSTSGDVTFVNENDSVTISLGYQNLSVGDEVPYTISGDVDLNDFTPPLESYNGKFVIGDPLTEKVDLFLADDKTFDEGDEILTLTLDGVNEAKSIVVKDTSRQTEVYGLSAPASTNENASFSISLNTQFVTSGTEVPYTLSGNYEPEDFNPPLTSSTGTFIVGEDETLTLSVADDKTWAENNESLTLTLDGKGISVEVDIVDSSIADPVYELVASPSNVNEGEALTITLNATNVPANTTIGYSIDAVGGGISLTDDFDSVVSSTGSFTVGSNTSTTSSDSITFNLKEDKLTETAAESLILTLDGGLGSVTVPIADTSKTEIFTLESSAVNDTIGEGGDPLVITLTTQNVPDGTYGYTIQGINDDDLNLANSDPLQGNFVLVGGTDTITLDIKADAVTEIPNDVIDLSLNNGKASIQITVEDTSKTPVYDLSSSPQISVNEGVSLRIELQTTNVSETSIPYSVEGIQAADLDIGSDLLTGGSFSLDSNGYGFIDFLIKADKVTEGDENLILTLDGGLGTISINVLDTSKDPIWELTTSPIANVDEGVDLLITLQTQNVDAGTYAYNITGTTGFGPDDLDDGSDPLSGVFTVSGSPSSETLTLKIKKDYSSGEGDETITISLPDVAEVADVNVVINDSSSADASAGPVITLNRNIESMDMKSNSTVLALGASSLNRLDVYELVSGNWVHYKSISSVSGVSYGDYFGDSVALSDDKEIVMGGTIYYSSQGVFRSGRAFIYKFNNSTGEYDLHQLIEPPVPESSGAFGRGLSISQDKSTITIGEYGKKRFHIYKLNTDTDQYDHFQTIHGDSTYGGISSSLNSDGSVVIEGHYRSGGLKGGFSTYLFNPLTNSYEEQTSARLIVGENHTDFGMTIDLSDTTNLWVGWLVDISPDGNMAVVSGWASVNSVNIWVFDWDSEQLKWMQRQTIASPDGYQGFGSYGLAIDDHPTESNLFRIAVKGYNNIIYTFDLMKTLSTYSFAGPDSVDEGQDLTLTLNTLGINGDIAYTISGITDSDLRSGSAPLTGNFNVVNETGSITLKLKEDSDGLDGSLTITVDQGGENEASKTVTINDITQIYDLSSNPQISVNEGVSLRIELQTTNVSETSIPYSVEGIQAADLDIGSALLTGGSFNLDSNGYGYLDFHIKEDKVTEGDENLILTLDGGLGTISVNVLDTSKTPIWNLSAGQSSPIDEGTDLMITLQTQNVDAGDYAYSITGTTGFGPEDLDDGSDPLTGVFTITGATNDISSDSITLKIKKDYSSGEDTETITISLDNGEVSPISIDITDSSSADATPNSSVSIPLGAIHSIDTKSNSTVMAASSYSSRTLHIYDLVNGDWVEDKVISGPVINYFGDSVAVSDDKEIVMGGAIHNATDGVYRSGIAYIYKLVDGDYALHQTIEPPVPTSNGLFGRGLSISQDKSTISIGEYYNAGGKCHIYKLNTNTDQYELFQTLSGGDGGISSSLSADGSILFGSDMYENGSQGGVVRYKLNTTNNTYELENSIIYGVNSDDSNITKPSSMSLFSWLVDISPDGNVGVVSAVSQSLIWVLDWDSTQSKWMQRQTISSPDGVASFGAGGLSIDNHPTESNLFRIAVKGYNNIIHTFDLMKTLDSYSLAGPDSVDEGQDLTLTLNTLGINGDVAYTISGITDADLDIAGGSASTNGVFQVANETGSITLKLLEDADNIDGSFTITVDQGGENEASKTVTINDITILPETVELNMIEGYGGYGSISPDGTIVTSHAHSTADQADANVRIWSRNPVDSSISANPTYVITPPAGSSVYWGSGHISMNNDGTILAISDTSADKTFVHEYDSVSDSYILAHTIDNPGIDTAFGKASISADGTMMVIAHRRDKKVFTYQYSGSSWNLISSATVSLPNKTESVSISNYNKTVLVAGDQYENIYTYDWDPSTSSWNQRSGSPLSVGSGSAYGDSLSLTKDGDILVVGSDGGTYVTWQVYDWDGSQWILRFTADDDPDHSAVGAYISSSSIINGYFVVAVTYKRNTDTDFRLINVIETPQNP